MGVNPTRIVINGSFVTDVLEPNDVDCVLLLPPDDLHDPDADEKLQAGLPFLEIQVVDDEAFAYLVNRFFASDRDSVPKGMVEVIP